MNKSIDFALNKFTIVPSKLRRDLPSNIPKIYFDINLARLYHHYYIDSYGVIKPQINIADFEYLKFLSSVHDFRFSGNGPGASTGKKRTISNELGQAFCRYFLYEFCGVTYFAHMDKVLNKKTHPAFDGLQIKRIQSGDVPDYLCAKNANQPFIAEAKGRFSTISFTNSEFGEWREQFRRIVIVDKYNVPKKVKGYIVATKFCTELNRNTNKSKIFAEDPETVGEGFLSEDSFGIGRGCLSIHYSTLISKLGLNLFSESLLLGFVIPQDISFNVPIWRCIIPALKDELFVGGYYSDSPIKLSETLMKTLTYQPNILELGLPTPNFYGISLPIVKQLRQATLGNWSILSQISEMNDVDLGTSNIAWLRDGSISGGLEFFELVGLQNI